MTQEGGDGVRVCDEKVKSAPKSLSLSEKTRALRKKGSSAQLSLAKAPQDLDGKLKEIL